MSTVKTVPARADQKLRDEIKAQLVIGVLLPAEIARKLGCTYQLVNTVRRGMVKLGSNHPLSLRDPATAQSIEDALVRALRPAIKRIGARTRDPKTGELVPQSAVDFKNTCQGVGIMIDKARLLAEKSTTNVNSRSLAVAVVRRAGKTGAA